LLIKSSVKGKEEASKFDQATNAMEEELNEDASKNNVDFLKIVVANLKT
jgi:hypothetical protein